MNIEEDPEIAKWIKGPPISREDAAHLIYLATRRGRDKRIKRITTRELTVWTLWSHNMQEDAFKEIVAQGVPEELAKSLINDARKMIEKSEKESEESLVHKIVAQVCCLMGNVLTRGTIFINRFKENK